MPFPAIRSPILLPKDPSTKVSQEKWYKEKTKRDEVRMVHKVTNRMFKALDLRFGSSKTHL